MQTLRGLTVAAGLLAVVMWTTSGTWATFLVVAALLNGALAAAGGFTGRLRIVVVSGFLCVAVAVWLCAVDRRADRWGTMVSLRKTYSAGEVLTVEDLRRDIDRMAVGPEDPE